MVLKIGDKKIDQYNGLTISLEYDTVASKFSFDYYFDPNNPDHKAIFKPGRYAAVTIEHDGELLITGTLLSPNFRSSAVKEPLSVNGYSRPGVLEDCEIPVSAYPLQTKGLTLQQITERVIKPFGLKLIVDPSVSSLVSTSYKTSTASDTQTCKAYLAELASQKHVILTHDQNGNLVLTRANISAAPVYDFTTGIPGVRMELNFDGQKMHSEISLVKQQTKGRKDGTHKKGNAGRASFTNPYAANTFRPHVVRQTSGEVVDTSFAARNMLSDELKGIELKIELDRWRLNGKLLRPNTIITVTDPELYLYKKTRFFVAKVDFKGDNNAETASLTCYPTAVFSNETPENIFE